MKRPKTHFSQLQAVPVNFSESEIQSQAVQYLLDKGFLTVRVNSFAMMVQKRYIRAYYINGLGASKGFADLLAIKDNRCILLEIKTVKGKQSPEQIEFERYAATKGATVLTIRNINDLQTYLKDNFL